MNNNDQNNAEPKPQTRQEFQYQRLTGEFASRKHVKKMQSPEYDNTAYPSMFRTSLHAA